MNNLNDPARLAQLAATGLMDTPPEEAFDRAVRLATRLLGTPVSLVSLVDDRRQFFKAETGLPDDVSRARETPLSHSFCQHVVTADAPLVVNDARKDPALQDNLAIEDLGVVAYLGVPLHAPDGSVLGSFCAIQSEPREWTQDEVEILKDVVAGIEAEILLRSELDRSSRMEARATAAEERIRLALHAGQVGTYDYNPQTQKARWDDELFSIWGLSTDETDVFAAARRSIHPDDRAMWEADVANSLNPEGEGVHDLQLRITRPDTGELRWLHAAGRATFEDGKAVRMLGTVRDITAEKKAEERAKMLTQELNHRVKNLFAVVSGMISMTARSSTTPKEMGNVLRGRVEALASAHALIQPAISGSNLRQTDVTLQTLTSAILEPHCRESGDLTLTGPPLPLNPDAAANMALVLYELATNSAKYGALSESTGRLQIEWDFVGDTDGDQDEALQLVWTETGGPTIEASPQAKGFGSKLINLILGGQIRGGLNSDWRRTGVRHTLSIPASYFR